ncbi:D-alanyl-D-alanine dipeptidase [Acidithiobacillus thiooxidans]|uniref:D-alanyl-D-alanine dipeptidase n=1 Tax=Acidithiobacillus thiooxidans TaxID=930 RepID=UPI0029C473FC|nr:D-alanyl-D-alanine dipeptidase [Acidithiobacillus thiooxidans]MDX5936348.1 D-alanyl-D-alanine dipeptidase [Acidithiobacillus thiooxidans]
MIKTNEFDVIIDLMYSKNTNVFGKALYPQFSECKLHTDAAICLQRASKLLKPLGLKIKIFDAYRPQSIQKQMWEMIPNGKYLADPKIGSNHSRGVALDISLIDANQCELSFGTAIDEMDVKSHHFNLEVDQESYHNRLTLLSIMVGAGFKYINNEWWHYELPNSKEYPLLDDSL